MAYTTKDFRKWLQTHDTTVDVLSEQTGMPLSTLKGCQKGGRIPAYVPKYLDIIDALKLAKDAVVSAVGYDPEDEPLIHPCPICGVAMEGSHIFDAKRSIIRHPATGGSRGDKCPLDGLSFATTLERWNRRYTDEKHLGSHSGSYADNADDNTSGGD